MKVIGQAPDLALVIYTVQIQKFKTGLQVYIEADINLVVFDHFLTKVKYILVNLPRPSKLKYLGAQG